MVIRKFSKKDEPRSDDRKYTRDLAGLTLAFNDANQDIRRWAAKDLVNIEGAEPVLVSRLAIERSAVVKEAIIMSLATIGNKEAIQGLVSCIRSEDAALRNDAVEVMKHLPKEISPLIHKLLHDQDSDVRILSINILESLCHPNVENWLIDVITHDGHVNVCATAVDLLGEVGSEAAVSPLKLLKGRFNNEPYINFAADLALKRILEE
jgi:HEAT repeat protein